MNVIKNVCLQPTGTHRVKVFHTGRIYESLPSPVTVYSLKCFVLRFEKQGKWGFLFVWDTRSATTRQMWKRSEDHGSQEAHGSEATRPSVAEGRQPGQILTNTLLESQRDSVNPMRNINDELKPTNAFLCEISNTCIIIVIHYMNIPPDNFQYITVISTQTHLKVFYSISVQLGINWNFTGKKSVYLEVHHPAQPLLKVLPNTTTQQNEWIEIQTFVRLFLHITNQWNENDFCSQKQIHFLMVPL